MIARLRRAVTVLEAEYVIRRARRRARRAWRGMSPEYQLIAFAKLLEEFPHIRQHWRRALAMQDAPADRLQKTR